MNTTLHSNSHDICGASRFPAQIRAAIFDYDGTILDSMPMWSTTPSRFVRSLGKEPEPGFDERIKHMSLEESSQIFRSYGATGSDEEIIDQIMELVLESYEKELQPKPGVMNVLEELQQRGILMCIATQTPSRMIKAANQRLGLDIYFDEIFSCSEWNTHKREPRIYELSAAHLKTTPAETLVFEDVYYAVETASQAGFPVIGIYDDSSADDRERIKKSSLFYLDSYSSWPGLEHFLKKL